MYPFAKHTKFVVAALTLGLSLSVAAEKSACPNGGTMSGKCAKLLKGVVHLSDNDVRFRTASGACVLVDPMAGPADEAAVKSGAVKPDLILITHPHGDHFQPGILKAYLEANPEVVIAGPTEVAKLADAKGIAGVREVGPGQEYTMAGITFETVPAYFENADHHPKARQWVGYVLHLNGARYYVTGDTQPLAEMAAVKADAVFPLLYGCGGNTDQALKMAKLSGASVVVPVHHGGSLKAIQTFIGRLPTSVASGYFIEGRFVSNPIQNAAAGVAATN